jgi:cytochrome P450
MSRKASALHFDPYSIEFATNPYPIYKHLRDEAPVYFHEGLNFWALSRYADVMEAHRDSETFSSAGGVTIEGNEGPAGANLITKDLPEHRWHKALVTKVFTRERMNGMEDFVRGLCVKLLEEAGSKAEFDFVKDFAVKLPLTVISELIGIPEAFRADIHHFANVALMRGEMDPMQMYQAKIASDRTYAELVRIRRATPRDDVITLLIETEFEDDAGGKRNLTDDELSARFTELAIAGHETVAKAIPNGAMAFARFPTEKAKVLRDPALMSNVVEEILRFDPPSQLQGRTTTRDVELHGKTIPAGMRTMLLTGAATRDERRFENPDVFDVTRDNDMASIYFGYGIHRCLGIHLARLEIRVAFEELFKRFPDFEAFPERETRKVLSNVRGADTLPFRAGAHA